MGRKRRHDTRRERETFDFANEVALPTKKRVVSRPFVTHTAPKLNLRPVEDRRTWHPQGKKRPAASLDAPRHRLVVSSKPLSHPAPSRRAKPSVARATLPHTVQFAAPARVLICIRRKKRKEVLFAKKLTGKGARARRHRQSEYTGVKC